MAASRTAVLIADSSAVFRSGLRHLLEADHMLKVVGEAAEGEQVIALGRDLLPDILLLGLGLPNLFLAEALERVGALPHPVKVLLMSDSIERKQLISALHLGAHGFIAKDAETSLFLKAIHCVAKGELWVERDVLIEWARFNERASQLWLTAREREIVHQILAGCSNREIAAKLQITEHTVKRHLTNIYDKLGCSTRLELSLYAMYHRI